MKKTLFIILGIIILGLTLVVCMFGLINYDNVETSETTAGTAATPEHTHTFAKEWSTNETEHWHSANCEHTGEVQDKDTHNFVNDICGVCGYKKANGDGKTSETTNSNVKTPEHTHTFAKEWSTNETEHWHSANCEHTGEVQDKGGHNFVDGVCDVCGYEQTQSGGDDQGQSGDNQQDNTDGKFTVTWKNDNGEILEVDTDVAYGSMPTYDGETPTKSDSITHVFTFQGWSPSVLTVTSDLTIVANYSSVERELFVGARGTFGTYPMGRIFDESFSSTLDQAAGELPQTGKENGWTSYRYYVENEQSDCMWYKDITHTDGAKYRGVYIESFRPINASLDSSASCQDDNGYSEGKTYWYKFYPITWRVLSFNEEQVFVVCDAIIDAQPYFHSWSEERTIGNESISQNNYKYSDIRKYLTEDFYNVAFSLVEKEQILTTEVDNSLATARDNDNNDNICENTNDKVFLLSYKDVYEYNNPYGFNKDSDRRLSPTSYALCQGLELANMQPWAGWWLRSPSYGEHYADSVTRYGEHYGQSIAYACWGVVPAIVIER